MTKNASSNSRSRRNSDVMPLLRRPYQAFLALLIGLGAAASFASIPATAQERSQSQVVRSAVLIVDFEQLFQETLLGQSIQQQLDERRMALAGEIAEIDAAMANEELELTNKRSELSAEEFRTLADAFDEKVQRLRTEQDEKAQALAKFSADEQLRFRQAVLPFLGQLMLEAGASVSFEKRNVLIFNDAVHVTSILKERMDAQVLEDRQNNSSITNETADDIGDDTAQD